MVLAEQLAIIFVLCLLITQTSVVHAQDFLPTDQTPSLRRLSKAHQSFEAYMRSGLDPSINPCADFYQYACGGFFKTNNFGYFSAAQEDLKQTLVDILERNTTSRPISTFYMSCKAMKTISDDSYFSPLFPLVRSIRDAQDKEELMYQVGHLSLSTPQTIFASVSPALNAISADKILVPQLSLAPLSLPDKQWYTEERFQVDRDELKKDINQTLFEFVVDSGKAALAVFNLETRIAEAMLSQAEFSNRSIELIIPDDYPTLRVLGDLYPITIGAFLRGYLDTDILADDTVIYEMHTHNLEKIESIFRQTDLDTLKAYVHFRLFSVFDGLVNHLKGAPDQEVADNTIPCALITTKTLPDLVGIKYMETKYSSSINDSITSLARDIVTALRQQLTEKKFWMDKETQALIREKLDDMKFYFGSAEVALDYESVDLREHSYIKNVMTVTEFKNKAALATLGQKGSPLQLTPAWVNAFFSPDWNSVNFPAGILQPPFLDDRRPSAMNYGSIGHVISHEITHAFDPNGIHIGKNGKYKKKWWVTEQGKKIAEEKWQCFQDAYSELEVRGENDTLLGFVNGKMTVTENIADSGISIAFRAFQNSGSIDTYDGFTAEQLFFISAAQNWCRVHSNKQLLATMLTNVHSPSKARANGFLRLYDEFSRVFRCPSGSFMNRQIKCSWWGGESNQYC